MGAACSRTKPEEPASSLHVDPKLQEIDKRVIRRLSIVKPVRRASRIYPPGASPVDQDIEDASDAEDLEERKRRLARQWRQSVTYNARHNEMVKLRAAQSDASANPPSEGQLATKMTVKKASLQRSLTQVAVEIVGYYETDKDCEGDQCSTDLERRLHDLKLKMLIMGDDGNCQFRSCSQQLYGTQDHYQRVRQKVVDHMHANSDTYSIYFETEQEWEQYISNMAKDRTWGDELTLHALTDAYGTVVHVIQSTEKNWYLVYHPKKRKTRRQVFVTYLSPVHYNALAPA
mmetsp:Transcript_17504/g.38147  ORF Transcript_17504/g.38147 Transcript_17504/m.38147 type:complete len:288 (+) Transcript_17504:263-1126(+)|eukprot:CAMPEP_0118939834 /NCGR_PEP_ID=MMETSP1169-20130426/29949_1 /TAXON_ID=36882 /ORGANISM="Pyramimonas obovata, Strain CCMP722" /LENGTH=287 /DNA_ID=CAMNT_0006884183 /DNA_START=203 /DNA_END=1066 /DNA_ORIENTATION=-